MTGDRLSEVDKLQIFLIVGYLSISGIYWFPGISHTLIAQVKLIVYGLICVIGALRIPRLSGSVGRFVIGLGITAILTFAVNVISVDFSAGVAQGRDFVEPLLWIIGLFGVRPIAHRHLMRSLTIGMLLFFVVSLYPLFIYLGVAPNFYAPFELIDPFNRIGEDHAYWVEMGSIAGGGFAGQATTWAVIVPPATLLLLALYEARDDGKSKNFYISNILVLTAAVGIASTSARGGTFALIIVWSYSLFATRDNSVAGLVLLIVTAVLGISLGIFDFLPENFFRGFTMEGDLFSILNEASTGRVGTYLHAWECFLMSPIYGVGPQAAISEAGAVHNTFLKILAESGVVVSFCSLLLAMRVFSMSFGKGVREQKDTKAALTWWPESRLVVLSGLILSMVEPNTIFGTFNASAIFWFGVWLSMARPIQLSYTKECEREANARGMVVGKFVPY